MTDLDLFVESSKAANRYPENVVRHNTYTHNLEAYRATLKERAGVLFCMEGKAHLDLWEYDDALPGLSALRNLRQQRRRGLIVGAEFYATSVSSRFELKTRFEGEHMFDNKDPRCRYM